MAKLIVSTHTERRAHTSQFKLLKEVKKNFLRGHKRLDVKAEHVRQQNHRTLK